jgi:RimJ/RimL family protein N-acetyltransferase
MNDRVRLRPVTDESLTSVEAMFADPEAIGIFNWGGYKDPTKWRKAYEENGLLGGERSVLIIDSVDGEELGFLSWRPGSGLPPCWEIGISLWPHARGQGYGAEAQAQLVRYLFANTPCNRIQAFTELDNIAEQRALEKAGFTREGVMRELNFRDGAWRDEVVYGIIRSDLNR